MSKFLRKYHKWAGLILILLIILFSLSGIILNHRSLFSGIDVNRNWLPGNYQLKNWNLAQIRSGEKISGDSILLYGYAGIWLTDSIASKFEDFNTGFQKGVDNRKIFKVLKSGNNELLAGTLNGLYQYNSTENRWKEIHLPTSEKNVVDLLEIHDSIYILTRSELLLSTNLREFKKVNIPAPPDYDNKISLFKTFWVIHSGDIYGLAGKLIVDSVALIFIFLSTTGFIQYIRKKTLKKKHTGKENRKKIKKSFKLNLKYHHNTGWISLIIILITTLTGVFLRPPLLIAIADSRVPGIPHTSLDSPNPWFDNLRRIHYIEDQNLTVLVSSEGFYYSDDKFKSSLKKFKNQPPVSIMGVTVLEDAGKDCLVVGSFSGFYKWNFSNGEIYDLMEKKPYHKPVKAGPPVGNYKITGYTDLFSSSPIVFDYDRGTLNPFNRNTLAEMPESILKSSPISLWNFAQEIHTGRIYQFILGKFYILVVPLTGIGMLFLIIAGVIIRFKYHTRKKSS